MTCRDCSVMLDPNSIQRYLNNKATQTDLLEPPAQVSPDIHVPNDIVNPYNLRKRRKSKSRNLTCDCSVVLNANGVKRYFDNMSIVNDQQIGITIKQEQFPSDSTDLTGVTTYQNITQHQEYVTVKQEREDITMKEEFGISTTSNKRNSSFDIVIDTCKDENFELVGQSNHLSSEAIGSSTNTMSEYTTIAPPGRPPHTLPHAPPTHTLPQPPQDVNCRYIGSINVEDIADSNDLLKLVMANNVINDTLRENNTVVIAMNSVDMKPVATSTAPETELTDEMKPADNTKPNTEKPETTETRNESGDPYKCITCGYTSESITDMTNHKQCYFQPKANPLKCTLCGVECFNKMTFNVHMNLHANRNPFSCSKCDSSFICGGDLQSHMHSHSDRFKPRRRRRCNAYLCSFCGEAFGSVRELNAHRESKHPDIKPFKCDICNIAFKIRVELTNHKRVQHSTSYSKHKKCKICSARFKHNSTLTWHMNSHANNRVFKCEHCSASFKVKCTLDRHSRLHSANSKFKCRHCNGSFPHQVRLERHIARWHTNIPYNCTDCTETFISKYDLTNHVRYKHHTEEKPFKCQKCLMAFANKYLLTSHSLEHAKYVPKPFSCDKCSYTSRTQSRLTIHQQRKHTGPKESKKKQHKCTQCDRSYTRYIDFASHVRSHAAYACADCHFTCETVEELRVHIPVHTREKYYPCTQCPCFYTSLFMLLDHLKTEHSINKTYHVHHNA